MTCDEDRIDKAPDMMGVAGRAWGIRLSLTREILEHPPEIDPTVSAWLVEAPKAHPVWHSYYVFAMHLRPIPGRESVAVFKFGATHEFWVYAADPDFPREPIIEGTELPKYLNPPQFVAQFVTTPGLGPVVADELARRFIRNNVIAPVVSGALIPDTDFHSQWVRRFGNEMLRDSVPAKEKQH